MISGPFGLESNLNTALPKPLLEGVVGVVHFITGHE